MSAWRVRTAVATDFAELHAWAPDVARAGADDADASLLVLEERDGERATLRACARVRRGIGLTRPRYWYHVGGVVHAAPDLRLFLRERTLLLGNDLTGATQVSDLRTSAHADASARSACLDRLLDATLLLLRRDFLHGETHDPRLVVELRGTRDAQGRSPFWHALGRHFYTVAPDDALAKFGPAWLSHVASLLPRHPIVVSLLEAAAGASLGQACSSEAATRAALERAGLRWGQYVTIDDAGPVYETRLDPAPGARPTRRRVAVVDRLDAARPWLVAADRELAAHWIPAAATPHGVLQIAASDAHAAQLAPDQSLWTWCDASEHSLPD